jgi:hypothetical protein
VDPEVPGSNPGGGTIPSPRKSSSAPAKLKRLAVGVTGHRLNQLPPEVQPLAAAAIAYAMDLCLTAAQSAHGPGVKATMVSAIAEGADRMAADAALKRRWRLETPLPFQVPRYLEDFADSASKAAFEALLKRSKRVEASPAADLPSPAPYAAVGEMIVAWSDVLIALWNGQAPKGPGGTAEVAAKMLAKGGPVVWIPSQTGGPIQLVLPKGPGAEGPLAAALAERIAVIGQPDAMRVAS